MGQEISSQINDLRTNIETQFVDQRNVCYRLHSVFIHRGGASSGHYWIYIYDFECKIWRKYNDSYVTKVDATEVFGRDPLIPPATPYFLTYVKDGLQDQLIKCVHRNPVELPPKPEEDIVMEDVIPSVEFGNVEESGVGFRQVEDVSRNPGVGYKVGEYIPVTEWDSKWDDSSTTEHLANW